jgi:hypothetical protein
MKLGLGGEGGGGIRHVIDIGGHWLLVIQC